MVIKCRAPTSNMQSWHFVVVTDPDRRVALAEIYRKGWEIYLTPPGAAPNPSFANPIHQAMQLRVTASAQYLADHLHEVPVHVIPCFTGRVENQPAGMQSALWGRSVQPHGVLCSLPVPEG